MNNNSVYPLTVGPIGGLNATNCYDPIYPYPYLQPQIQFHYLQALPMKKTHFLVLGVGDRKKEAIKHLFECKELASEICDQLNKAGQGNENGSLDWEVIELES